MDKTIFFSNSTLKTFQSKGSLDFLIMKRSFDGKPKATSSDATKGKGKKKKTKTKEVKILTDLQKQLLPQIEHRLKTLTTENPVLCVDIRQEFAAEDILKFREALDRNGIIVFTNALDDGKFAQLQQSFLDAFLEMFGGKTYAISNC